MKKFCPKCGKETEELHESLCGDCYCQKFKNESYKKKMNVSVCKCGSLGYSQQWKKNIMLDDFIDSLVKKDLEATYKNKTDYIFSFERKELQDTIIIKTEVEKSRMKIADYTYVFNIKSKMCPLCSSEKKGYYEAVLQLRGKKETLKDFRRIVDGAIDLYKGQNSFAKVVGQADKAVDFHLGTKKVLGRIKKEISSKYNVETKTSFSLYKIKDGKEITRTTLLIREIE